MWKERKLESEIRAIAQIVNSRLNFWHFPKPSNFLLNSNRAGNLQAINAIYAVHYYP
ncbi:hypothetical protein [Microcoleus sp. S36b_A2]|uniref:hypothetical protein n=1 Tax=Microcoleus sp. S36b_A2 TaxID=3055418 RepID=UPI002FD10FE8